MKVIDLHCDTIAAIYEKNESLFANTGQYDMVRALKAGIIVQFFAMFTMPTDRNTALRNVFKLADKFFMELDMNSQVLYHLQKYDDLLKVSSQGKIGGILHLEGAEALGTDLEILRGLYRLGLRSIGLTWNNRNLLADGVDEDPGGGGLSRKGKEIIKEMDRLGIILDLAHISEKSFYEALACYNQPIMVTHANARKLCAHSRNLTDQQLLALAEHGGVVGITQVGEFVKESTASLDDMIDHIVYAADLIGVEHVALGSDFDGADDMVISDVKGYKILPECLQKRGFTKDEIEMILYRNTLAILKQVLSN